MTANAPDYRIQPRGLPQAASSTSTCTPNTPSSTAGTRFRDLVQHVKDCGMTAVAMTDHGNLHGAAEFYTKARARRGSSPSWASRRTSPPQDRGRRTKSTARADGGFHLVLLAENDTGWRNLLKLSDQRLVPQRGFYYKPRMDKSTLASNGATGSSRSTATSAARSPITSRCSPRPTTRPHCRRRPSRGSPPGTRRTSSPTRTASRASTSSFSVTTCRSRSGSTRT